MKDLKEHWENIYSNKKLEEVSWYQPTPETSLKFITEMDLPKNAAIIDVGGGDSFLVDNLLKLGYTNISVLDISGGALKRAKERLGKEAERVSWIEADASEFQPDKQYDLWHDRAAFHFLTDEDKIGSYLKTLENSVKPGGHVVLGTFSDKGPDKCSGIVIRKYSTEELGSLLSNDFEKLKCMNLDHHTPWDSVQNFSFCSFRKLK